MTPPLPSLHFRDACQADLPAIVAMLADDPLGAGREDASLPLAPAYLAAFRAIEHSAHLRLVVAQQGEQLVGTMHLAVLPGLSAQGAWHGQIEAVRIAASHRGAGHGEAFVEWALGELRAAGCSAVQLTSHESRAGAHRFWRKLGFAQSHAGFKRAL